MPVQVTPEMLQAFSTDARTTGVNIVQELKATISRIAAELPDGFKGRALPAFLGVQDRIDRALTTLVDDLNDAALTVETHGQNVDDADIKAETLVNEMESEVISALNGR